MKGNRSLLSNLARSFRESKLYRDHPLEFALCPEGETRERFRNTNRISVNQSKIVGSGDDVDLKLNSPFVSEIHCEFIYEGRSLSVVDKGSSNGTYVNGNRITGATKLKRGDILEIPSESNYRFRVEVYDPLERVMRAFRLRGV